MLKEILNLGHGESFRGHDGSPQRSEEPSSQRGGRLILFSSKQTVNRAVGGGYLFAAGNPGLSGEI